MPRKLISEYQSNEAKTAKDSLDLGFLEYFSEGVVVINQDRLIIGANTALESLLGWSQTELVGRPCTLFLGCQDPDSCTSLCQHLCPLINLQTWPFEKHTVRYQNLSIAHKNGQRLVVNASFAPLELSFLNISSASNNALQEFETSERNPEAATRKNKYTIVVLRDVTEAKRQEKIEYRFITAASHQLRTPLASVKASIGLLIDNVGPGFNPSLQKLLKNIQSSTSRMERLVNDLIELVNLQNGQVKMQLLPIEAQELVYQALKLNQNRLEAKNQTLKTMLPAQPLYVKADILQMSQVLGHLISNASKFSQPGQNIELQITTKAANPKSPTGTEEVVFCVKDEGIGIARDEQDLIFEKFYQSQVEENNSEIGAGLGLPLAKALIELNGGRLWFESEQGKGANFYFSLQAVNPIIKN